MDATVVVVVVGPGFPRVFANADACKRGGSSLEMQLRAFNEVSRLAADSTRRGAASEARVSFSFGIHYPFDPS